MSFLSYLLVGTSLGMAVAASADTALAQHCPSKSVRLIVPFSPGGGTELVVRTVATKLTELRKQSVIVDNRGGASGNIASELVARAAPDGCTLLFGHSSPIVINPILFKALPFDTVKDFAPVSLLGSVQFLLVVHRTVPAGSVPELIALIKSKPGELPYGSGGAGSPPHLAAELFKSRTGVDMIPIPYKGGGPLEIAVLSGEVKIVFSAFSTSLPHVKTGVLKSLAVTGPKRSPAAPDVPTMQELGFADFDVRAWYGILAPAATPKAVIAGLNRDLVKIVGMPDVSESFRRGYADPATSTPDEFAAFIKAQKLFWGKVLQGIDIKPD